MKKFLLLVLGLLVFMPSVDAAIIRRVVAPAYSPYNYSYGTNSFGYGTTYPRVYYNNYSGNYYNNNGYYNQPVRRYYRPYNYNYRYRRPNIIFRKSDKYIDTSVKNVAYKSDLNGIDLNKLSRIEGKILGRNYAYDTPQSRIERIETKMFGANQSGNYKDRFATIEKASKEYKAYSAYQTSPYEPCYQNQNSQQYYTPPIVSGSGFRSMIGSLGNYMFGGYPTGFTPQMDPAYMDYFEAERAMQGTGSGESVDIRTNRGYYKRDTQRSTGMGVTLLD